MSTFLPAPPPQNSHSPMRHLNGLTRCPPSPPSKSKTKLQVDVWFTRPFALDQKPLVFCTALATSAVNGCTNYPVTVYSVTNKGFSASIRKSDKTTNWEQIQLYWRAELPGTFCFSQECGKNLNNNLTEMEYHLGFPFGSLPSYTKECLILVQAFAPSSELSMVTSVRSIQRDRVTVVARRIGEPTKLTWGAPLTVYCRVLEPREFPANSPDPPSVQCASIDIPKNPMGRASVQIDVRFHAPFFTQLGQTRNGVLPQVFCTAMAEDPLINRRSSKGTPQSAGIFDVTLTNVTNYGFTANVRRVDGSFKWEETVQVMYAAEAPQSFFIYPANPILEAPRSSNPVTSSYPTVQTNYSPQPYSNNTPSPHSNPSPQPMPQSSMYQQPQTQHPSSYAMPQYPPHGQQPSPSPPYSQQNPSYTHQGHSQPPVQPPVFHQQSSHNSFGSNQPNNPYDTFHDQTMHAQSSQHHTTNHTHHTNHTNHGQIVSGHHESAYPTPPPIDREVARNVPTTFNTVQEIFEIILNASTTNEKLEALSYSLRRFTSHIDSINARNILQLFTSEKKQALIILLNNKERVSLPSSQIAPLLQFLYQENDRFEILKRLVGELNYEFTCLDAKSILSVFNLPQSREEAIWILNDRLTDKKKNGRQLLEIFEGERQKRVKKALGLNSKLKLFGK